MVIVPEKSGKKSYTGLGPGLAKHVKLAALVRVPRR